MQQCQSSSVEKGRILLLPTPNSTASQTLNNYVRNPLLLYNFKSSDPLSSLLAHSSLAPCPIQGLITSPYFVFPSLKPLLFVLSYSGNANNPLILKVFIFCDLVSPEPSLWQTVEIGFLLSNLTHWIPSNVVFSLCVFCSFTAFASCGEQRGPKLRSQCALPEKTLQSPYYLYKITAYNQPSLLIYFSNT